MKSVLLVNQGLSANLGDKAILFSLRNYFESKNYKVDISGFTHYVESNLEIDGWENYTQKRALDIPIALKWRIKAKHRLESEISKINKHYDYLVIGGGQLIKSRCYFPYAMSSWIDMSCGIADKRMLIGVGADESFSTAETMVYKRVLSKFDEIIVRDSFSKNVLKDTFGANSVLAPDVAFLLYFYFRSVKKENNCSIVMPFDYRTYRYHFQHDICYETYMKKWADIIEEELNNYKNVRLMYTTIEDKRECFQVYKRLGDAKNRVKVQPAHSLDGFMNELFNADHIISGRMHALILGMISGCRVDAFYVSKKIESFVEEYLLNSFDVESYAIQIKQRLDSCFGE